MRRGRTRHDEAAARVKTSDACLSLCLSSVAVGLVMTSFLSPPSLLLPSFPLPLSPFTQ